MGFELVPVETPSPLASGDAGDIHSAFGALTQNILHGDDGDVGGRHHRQTDELPVEVGPWDFSAQVAEESLFVFGFGDFIEPAEDRSGVVSVGIDNGVFVVVVGVIDAGVKVAFEREDQDVHVGQVEFFEELGEFRGDDSEDLDDQRRESEMPD